MAVLPKRLATLGWGIPADILSVATFGLISSDEGGVPTITSVTPNWGVPEGGTEVVIVGTGFTGVTAVTFEYDGEWSAPAAAFNVDSEVQITATSPAAITNVITDIRVTNASGTSEITENDKFSFLWRYTEAITIDGIVAARLTKTFTIDGIIKEILTETFTIDGVVKEVLIETFTVDGIVRPTIEYYSRGNPETLPIDAAVQATLYSSDDYTDVATSDDNRVSISSTANYLNHLFKVRAADNTKHIKVEVEVQSSKAPSVSTVYLQIYNRNSEAWETLDSNTTTAADTDFSLIGYQDTDLSYYYDTNYEINFRVYQAVS